MYLSKCIHITYMCIHAYIHIYAYMWFHIYVAHQNVNFKCWQFYHKILSSLDDITQSNRFGGAGKAKSMINHSAKSEA